MHKISDKILICSFYKFILINNTDFIKKLIYEASKRLSVVGTVLISKEGINGTLAGNIKSIKKIEKIIKNSINDKIEFKFFQNSFLPFLKLKIKIKNEIVKLGEENLEPGKLTGKYINPKDWDDFIEDNNIILLDTRNEYEHEIGHFKRAIFPRIKNFSDFPNWFKKNKSFLLNKKIATYCTGGIRCEKATSFLIKNGFKNVFQLQGGILNYLSQKKNQESTWNGECFVFDDRVSVNKSLQKGKYVQCFACKSPISEKDLLSKYYQKGISCHKCFSSTSSKKKDGLAERQKQIKLAQNRGIKHLGFQNCKS